MTANRERGLQLISTIEVSLIVATSTWIAAMRELKVWASLLSGVSIAGRASTRYGSRGASNWARQQ